MGPLATLSLLLLLGGAAGQDGALVDQDGVRYYVGAGAMGRGGLALETADGEERMLFDGCLYAKVRDDDLRGRVRVVGAVDGGTIVTLDLGEVQRIDGERFPKGDDVDGRDFFGEPVHPEVETYMRAMGTAQLTVNGVPYADPALPPSLEPFEEPRNNFTALFFLAADGFRDDVTGAVVTRSGSYEPGTEATGVPGDEEAHFMLRGIGGGSAVTLSANYPTPLLPALPPSNAEPEHRAIYPMTNFKFGGEGVIELEARSMAPAGMTSLLVTVRNPAGDLLANGTVAPALMADDRVTLTIPLHRFGEYTVEVTGELTLADYAISFTQTPPAEPIDLRFWWEELQFGIDAMRHFEECQIAVGDASGQIIATHVGRPEPPQLDKTLIVLAVAGAIIVLLTAITLLGHAVATSRFRDTYKK